MGINWYHSVKSERVVRTIEKLLKTQPFVKVYVSPKDAVGQKTLVDAEGACFLVTKVSRKEKQFSFFDPYGAGRYLTSYSKLERFNVGENQTLDLRPNTELNTLIWRTHRKGENPQKRVRMRIGYTEDKYPVYLPDTFHIHKGALADLERWDNVACFEVAALEMDHPDYSHPIAYTYYPHHGTLGLTIDYGPWEPHPSWVDHEQKARDRLYQNYLKYKAMEPFKEGDIIRSPGNPEQVFIRYEDPDRTRMVLYSGKVIVGAESISRFQLVQRDGVVQKVDHVELPTAPYMTEEAAKIIEGLLDRNKS